MTNPHDVIREIVDCAENIAGDAGVGSSETAGVIVSFLAQRPSLMPAFMAGTLSPSDTGMLDHHNGVLSWHGQDGGIHRPDPSKARFPAPAPEPLPARTADDAIAAGVKAPAITAAMVNAFYEATEVTREGSIRNIKEGLAAALSTQESSAALAGDGKEVGR